MRKSHKQRFNRNLWPILLLLLGLAGLCQPALGQDDELTATVDRREVSANETLTLRVRYSGRSSGGQPDFSLLEENFEIINQRQSNQMSVVNGVMSSYTEWTLTLAPRRSGDLLIPSFRFQDRFSDAIQISVTEPQEMPDQLQDLFIETVLDSQEVYVQQQVVLTYRLYTSRSIESLDAQPLNIDGVRVEELPEERYQRRIDGVTYGVLEVRYALFPQTSNTFTIPAQTWTIRATTGPNRGLYGFGSGRYELRHLRTTEKTVQVEPKPDAYPADATWLPARKVELTEEWSESPTELEVGQPLTRTLKLTAEGLSAEQLPPLPLGEAPRGVKYYPDQAKQDNAASSEGISGTRTESMAIVPSEGGEVTLPAIQVQWWDVETDQLQTARLPARTLYVQGTTAPPAQAAASAGEPLSREGEGADNRAAEITSPDHQSATALPWQIATVVLAFMSLCFSVLWWHARRTARRQVGDRAAPVASSGSTAEKQAWRALQKTATEQDPRRLRSALLAWSAARWPEQPPHSLEELARLVENPAVAADLTALDAALYGRNGAPPDMVALVRNIQDWRRGTSGSPSEGGKPAALKPLY